MKGIRAPWAVHGWLCSDLGLITGHLSTLFQDKVSATPPFCRLTVNFTFLLCQLPISPSPLPGSRASRHWAKSQGLREQESAGQVQPGAHAGPSRGEPENPPSATLVSTRDGLPENLSRGSTWVLRRLSAVEWVGYWNKSVLS